MVLESVDKHGQFAARPWKIAWTFQLVDNIYMPALTAKYKRDVYPICLQLYIQQYVEEWTEKCFYKHTIIHIEL